LIASLVVAGTPSWSQTPGSVLEVAPENVDLEQPPLDAATVNAKVDALMEAAQRAKAQRTAAPPPTDREATWQPDGSDDASSSVDEIRNRIRVLRRLRSRQSASATAPNTLRTGPASKSAAEDTAPRSPARQAPDANLNAIEQNLANANQPVGEDDVPKSPQDTVQGTQLLPTPVNAMALGESLLRIGHFKEALQAFENVNADVLSASDRTWLDLMMALCRRRTGKLDPAEATLREIANDKSTDYPVQVAKWWLKHTEKMRDLKPRLEQLQADSDTLLERSKEFTNDQ
jgi:hypothetical protein